MKKIFLLAFLLTGGFVKSYGQLGSNAGDYFELESSSGNTMANIVFHKTWFYRNAQGADWLTTSVHDGIAVDVSFQVPHASTRVWWDRNPYTGEQSWGDGPQTYLGIFGGKVGVGTQSPKSLLDVGKPLNGEQLGTVLGRLTEGDGQLEGTFLGVRGYGTQANDYEGKSFALEHNFYGRKNSSINFYRGEGQTGGFITFSTFDNSERMRISPFGNVGIGTTTPNEKLSVNGKIRAQEIKVETANWPDYVFDQDYKIIGLPELDAYIKQHKHLPDMPSARSVESEGLAVGDMLKLQQKKIEELTLHLIEKDKALKAESAMNIENQKRIGKTEKELTELKELVNRLIKK